MVSHGNFVAYYRVSTARQGKSGLGLEASGPQSVSTWTAAIGTSLLSLPRSRAASTLIARSLLRR